MHMKLAAIAMLAGLMTVGTAPAGLAGPKACPPGLAKKSPACVPPGLAKKQGIRDDDHDRYHYRVGEVVRRGDYIIIREPGRYGLDPSDTYYRVGDQVLRVDRETREVLDLIGAVAAILD
ncbi:excinuclease ABC subunit A [Primorskyibacter flagellatus]|uniref:excinuclease ABC subunit A n=1 Tax=Primorskyibacter flagellatus TaxID=1387277 RepID=UPI003A90A6D9